MTGRCCESLRGEPSKEKISKDKSWEGNQLVLFTDRMVCARLKHMHEAGVGSFVDPGEPQGRGEVLTCCRFYGAVACATLLIAREPHAAGPVLFPK